MPKTENKGTEPQKPDRCGDLATLLLTSYGTQSRLMFSKYIKPRGSVRLERTGNFSIFITVFFPSFFFQYWLYHHKSEHTSWAEEVWVQGQIVYRKGLVDFLRDIWGRIGYQHKVDMAKSNKDRESCSPARFSVFQFEDLKSEEVTLLTL